ncbi:MAG TPA: hypothetical protein DEA22_09185 [Blastocatellia bacterium]|nr:hypothetical protein [Blastocatellia bacterium]
MRPKPKKKPVKPKESRPPAAADLPDLHPYYYDDATGYEKYDPNLDNIDETDGETRKISNKEKTAA